MTGMTCWRMYRAGHLRAFAEENIRFAYATGARSSSDNTMMTRCLARSS